MTEQGKITYEKGDCNHLERARGRDVGGGIPKGRYKDGREYEVMNTWSLSRCKTIRRGKRKDGRWTDWYYVTNRMFKEGGKLTNKLHDCFT